MNSYNKSDFKPGPFVAPEKPRCPSTALVIHEQHVPVIAAPRPDVIEGEFKELEEQVTVNYQVLVAGGVLAWFLLTLKRGKRKLSGLVSGVTFMLAVLFVCGPQFIINSAVDMGLIDAYVTITNNINELFNFDKPTSSVGVVGVTSSQDPLAVRENLSTQANGALNLAVALWGVDRNLIIAQMTQESGGNQNARGAAGEIGVLQPTAKTWEYIVANCPHPVKDRENVVDNIIGCSWYLDTLIEKWDNVEMALAEYNAGYPAIRAAGGGIPQNGVTPGYVRNIMYMWGVLNE